MSATIKPDFDFEYIVFIGLPDQAVQGVQRGITSNYHQAFNTALNAINHGAPCVSITRTDRQNKRPPKVVFGYDMRLEG